MNELCQPIFKKLKTNKGLGASNKVEVKNIIKEKKQAGDIVNSPSKKTMSRCNYGIAILVYEGILQGVFLGALS